jgi:hypothetical protein
MALNFPDTPSNGQVYLGENGIQYTYNLTNDSWTGKLQSSNVPIDPAPADVSVTPAFGNPSGTNPGSGTLADPFIITNSVVPTLGGTAESLQTITITNGKAGDQVIFTNNTTPTPIAAKYAQVVGVIDGNGKWTGKLTYNDSLGSETTSNISYTGNLQVGNTTVYFRWVVQQQATPPMIVTVGSALTGQALIGTELGATQPTVTGGILPYTYGYQWQTSDNGADFTGILNATSNVYTLVVSDIGKYIRCAATVSDSSAIQIVSITSNTAIVNAMSIDVSLSTTTPKAGDTITATAVTAGGVAPVTTAYQWKADDVNIAGATSTTYTVIEADKDKRLSCLVTTTDTSGTSVSKSSDPTDPVFSGTAPEINTVTLAEVTPDSPDRYTDQVFTVAVDMTSNTPKSDYALRGKVLGDLSVDVSTSIITKLGEQAVDGSWNSSTGTAQQNASWYSVAYGNGRFVSLASNGGSSGRGMYSTDGTTWTQMSLGTAADQQSWYNIAFGNGVFVGVAADGPSGLRFIRSTDGINWTQIETPNGTDDTYSWNDITFGNGKFVAVANNKNDGGQPYNVAVSADGVTWTGATLPDGISGWSVTYGDKDGSPAFIAADIGGNNPITRSTDGINWTKLDFSTDKSYYGFAYGNGTWVGVAYSNSPSAIYSTDNGLTWTTTSTPNTSLSWVNVTYGAGYFVAAGNTATAADQSMYSTDGITWELSPGLTGGTGFRGIAYGNSRFVMTSQDMSGSYPNASWSYTGTGAAGTEEVLTLTDTTGLSSINQGDTVVQNSGGTPVTTTITNVDTQIGSWVAGGEGGAGNTITYGVPSSGEFAGQGLYVSCWTSGANYSIDGINWNGGTSPSSMWSSVTYGNGVFAAVGVDSQNRCMYSTDGVNWSGGSGGQYTAADGKGWWSGIAYGNGKFVAVSRNGYESNYTNNIMYSTNGSSWTIVSNSIKWNSVTYGDGKFVAVGSDSTKVTYSTNGTSWTNVSAPDNIWYSVAYGNGKYVAVGDGAVMYSTDAISWTLGTITEDVNSVTYGDGKFVAVGSNGAVMYSYDGISWLAASAAEANNWTAVTYGGGKFVAIASSGVHPTMWSVDGTGSKIVTLTLTDDTNLANFRVGDAVQGNPDWNQSQEWSTTGTVTGTALSIDSNITKAFDGNITGGSGALLAAADNFVQYVFNPPIAISTASYFISMDGGSIVFNVGESDEVTDTTLSSVIVERSLSLASGVLKSFRATTNGSTQGAYLWGVKTNSKLLVDKSVPDTSAIKVTAIDSTTPSITTDGGAWSGTDGSGGGGGWNQTKVWSNSVSGTATSGYAATNAFNGSTAGVGWLTAVSTTSTWTDNITFTQGVRLYVFSENATASDAGSIDVTVDNNTEAIPSVAGSVGRWVTAFTGSGVLKKIESKLLGNINNYEALLAIEVDGVMLVDSGIPGAPTVDTSVTGPTQVAASGTVKTSGSREVTAAIQTSVITNVYADTGSWTGALIDGGGTAAVNKQQRNGAFGNGKVVFVSTFGGIISSTDGISFTTERNPDSTATNTNDLYDVAYGNGRFVAVGQDGTVPPNPVAWVQIDGESTWNKYNLGSRSQGYPGCIAFGNGKFVAPCVGENGRQWAVSTDGINWTHTADGTSTRSINAITFGGGYFCAGGTYDFLGFSTDGINWTSATSGTSYSSEQYQDATYGDGMWAITGNNLSTGNAVTYYTTNRTSWTKSSTNNLGGKSIGYGDGTWVLVDNDGATIQSTDDISSFSLSAGQPPQGDYQGIIYSFGRWILGTRSNAVGQASMWQSVFAGNSGTILTLTDTTDLARFTPGDVATQDSVNGAPSNGVYFTPNPEGTSAGVTNSADQYYQGNAFDGNTSSAGNFALATPITPITFTDKVEVLPAGEIGKAGINVGLAGETIVGNPGTWDNVWSTVASGGGVIYNFSVDPPNSATYAYAWRVDGTIVALTPTDAPGTGIVTASDSANKTLTMSDASGVWSANTGNYAVGPVKTTEVAGPYLTLSSSSGRWLVTESDYNTGLKLNRFVKSSSKQSVASLFTVMDNSGNISDLSVEDPGYTTMIGDPTYTTTFPSVFPSGQTPDVELPPGTKYQVEVVATNTLGNDNAFSNDVMPVAGLLQSSVITASESTTVAKASVYYSAGSVYITAAEVIANGTPLVSGQDVPAGSIIYILPNALSVVGDNPLKSLSSTTITGIYDIWGYSGGWTPASGTYNTADVELCKWVDQASFTDSYQLLKQADVVCFGSTGGGSQPSGINQILPKLTYEGGAGTTLTTTDNTNYNLFTVGDDVVESSGGTPVTSAITNVSTISGTYSTDGTYTNNANQIAPLANAYDGTYAETGQPAFPSGVNYWGIDTGTATQSGLSIPFSTKVRIYYNTNASSGASVSINGVSKNLPFTSSTIGYALDWTSGEITSPFTSIALTSANNSTGVYVSAIEVDGIVLTDGVPIKTLTFTNDTNLANFRVGDQLGGGSGFTPVVYTGNGTSQSITGVGFKPGLLWIKDRSIGNDHNLNTVSLFDDGKYLVSNSANGASDINGVYVTSIDDDGFSVGAANAVNGSGYDLVAWCWDAGNTTVTNNDGTIASQVRSNGNFSIVNFASNNATSVNTVGHGLNSIPKLIIIKSLTSGEWYVYPPLGVFPTGFLLLNSNASLNTGATFEEATDTIFNFPSAFSQSQDDPCIAYCWAETPGASSFGSYTGNGNVVGPVITTGFEPAFVMVKCSSNSGDWILLDAARSPSNPRDNTLKPNSADVENANDANKAIDFLSTGFQPVATGSATNSNGLTYIYAAFAGSSTITSINEAANQMTFDGGSFTTGESVTGPTFPPATGTIDSIGTQTTDAAIQTSTITNVDVMTDGLSPDGAKTDTDVTSVLTANGVTALTGMGLDNRDFDVYTTEVVSFNGNGTRLLSTNVITTEGVVYSGSNFQDWFAGLNSGGAGTGTAIQGEDSLTYACTFDPISITGQTITITTTTAGSVYILDQNGQKVYIIGENGTILTLTDTTDLVYFEPGDVVQPADGITVYANAPRTDTVPNTKTGIKYRMSITDLPSGSSQYTISQLFGGFPSELTNTGNVETWASATLTSGMSTVGTWGLAQTQTADEWRAQFISGSYAYAYVSLAAYTTSLANGTDMGEVGLSTIVTFTNLAAPSLTTNGGAWTGSDGTSSGDVADRETKVTGPVKTTEAVGPYLTLSSSSGRWLVTESDYDADKKLDTTVLVPLDLNQSNTAHVALFNALNTSLTAYPTDKQTFVDALRTKVSGLSLTTPELQVLCTASHTLIKRFVVTVAAYSGSNYFYIDGVRQATLALKKGTTYIFDQDEVTNAGHPLKIYTDANKTTEYTSGVNIVGTPGSALSRTAFLVPTNAPATLYYQCSNHAGMGGQLNIS